MSGQPSFQRAKINYTLPGKFTHHWEPLAYEVLHDFKFSDHYPVYSEFSFNDHAHKSNDGAKSGQYREESSRS